MASSFGYKCFCHPEGTATSCDTHVEHVKGQHITAPVQGGRTGLPPGPKATAANIQPHILVQLLYGLVLIARLYSTCGGVSGEIQLQRCKFVLCSVFVPS